MIGLTKKVHEFGSLTLLGNLITLFFPVLSSIRILGKKHQCDLKILEKIFRKFMEFQ